MAAIRHIVFDCADPGTVAGFWSVALAYTLDESWVVSIRHPKGHGPRLLFLKVPEQKTVKNRVHLDLAAPRTMAAEVRRLTDQGASMVREVREGGSRFTVMLDPEGNEFCVERGPEDRGEPFEATESRADVSSIRSITVDCADPARLADFWSAAAGYSRGDADEEGAIVDAPGDADPRLLFLKVPEAKTTKNRVHLDLDLGPMDAAVERLETLGGRRIERFEVHGIIWTVMADPEGNEFCVMNRG